MSEIPLPSELIRQAAEYLFPYGTKIPTTLDELSSLLEKNDSESASQIFELQRLLFIDKEQKHQTDEIVIILFSLPKSIQVLVVSIIEKYEAYQANLLEKNWNSIKLQFQTAELLESEVSEIENLSDLDHHLAQLKKLPMNLEFKDLKITVVDLASKLTSVHTQLLQLESIQSNIIKSKSGFGKFANSLKNLFVSSDSTYENQKKNLLLQLETQINQLPTPYQAAIYEVIGSIESD